MRSTRLPGARAGTDRMFRREGVQRDILPIVEGTTVNTRYGMVSTDHILFIAAGAFHVSKPSDLIPELQGRFPIRVELQSLTVEDFIKILTEPKSSLVKQATALLETEGLKLEFSPESLAEIANFAFRVNEATENIGARRLHTIMERVLDEISFDAPDLARHNRSGGKAPSEALHSDAAHGDATVTLAASAERTQDYKPSATIPLVERDGADGNEKVIAIDAAYVQHMVASIVKDQDLSRYIL